MIYKNKNRKEIPKNNRVCFFGNIHMSLLVLLIGFLFLIKGADIFVDGASSIAKKFKVPSMIIGLTIVAMGTSAPEAAVSITSSLAGQNDMAVANVVGSNLFNVLMVLGISSIIAKLPVDSNTIKKDAPLLLMVSALLLLFCVDMKVGRVEGLILLALFTYFIIDMIKTAKKSISQEDEVVECDSNVAVEVEEANFSMVKTILVCLVGIVGIVLGGDMVVDSATKIATSMGMSANLVGLTIVAVGTSLPEFVTSIVAIKKGETDIAIGNVVGSNLFNILFVLGLSAAISPIGISMMAVTDVIFMLITGVIMFAFMKKDESLVKWQGMIFVVLYIAYMAYSIMR